MFAAVTRKVADSSAKVFRENIFIIIIIIMAVFVGVRRFDLCTKWQAFLHEIQKVLPGVDYYWKIWTFMYIDKR